MDNKELAKDNKELRGEKMAKYYGTWSSNNGNTFNCHVWESNNFRALRKSLREAACGNLTGYNDRGHWSITDKDGNMMAGGSVRR